MVKALSRARRLAARAVPVTLILIGCGMIVVALALLADEAVAELSGGANARVGGVAELRYVDGYSAYDGTPGRSPFELSDEQRVRFEDDLGASNTALTQAVEDSSFGGGYTDGGRLMLAIGATAP